MAGVSGPCPQCGHTIVAPSSVSEASPQVIEASASAAVPQPQPQPQVPTAPPVASSVAPQPREVAGSLPQPSTERLPAGRSTSALSPVSAPPILAPVDPRPQSLRKRKAEVSSKGPNLPKILGWGVVLLGGAVVGTLAWLKFFTQPPVVVNPPVVAEGVGDEATARARLAAERKDNATIQAMEVVRAFLEKGAESPQVSLRSLATPAPRLNHPLFPQLTPADFSLRSAFREAGSDDYWVELAGPTGFPVFLVEQEGASCVLHSLPIAEQAADLLVNFLQDPSAGSYIGYFVTKPSPNTHPLVAVRDMAALDVRPAFPNPAIKNLAFPAVIEPHSAVAKRVEERQATTTWSKHENAVLEIRWAKTAEGESYLSLASILPCGWSKL